MSTSFIINLADLSKILEQIKIAERHAAGESLIDIVGQDSALLPFGLRTVDGSYNHLLPGQEQVGTADALFPRLLVPSYIDEADGDTMPLGPPGGPEVTNTNYDPSIPGGVDMFGVNLHSVADADPRIISNLIVDQTMNNKSALAAALLLAGSENPSGDADAIMAARDAAAAAAPLAAAAQAEEDASAALLNAIDAAAASAAAAAAQATADADAQAYADAVAAAAAAAQTAADALATLDALIAADVDPAAIAAAQADSDAAAADAASAAAAAAALEATAQASALAASTATSDAAAAAALAVSDALALTNATAARIAADAAATQAAADAAAALAAESAAATAAAASADASTAAAGAAALAQATAVADALLAVDARTVANAAAQAETDALDALNALISGGAPQSEIDAAQAIYDAAVIEAVTTDAAADALEATAQASALAASTAASDAATAAALAASDALGLVNATAARNAADAAAGQAAAAAAAALAAESAAATAAAATGDAAAAADDAATLAQATADADALAAIDARAEANLLADVAAVALAALNALIAADIPQATIDAAQAASDAAAQATADAETLAANLDLIAQESALVAVEAQAAADQAAADASSSAASHALLVTASDAADLAAANAASYFAALIDASGLEISADGSITIEHRSADIGLSPPNSGWMTLFGQFFDHGLDLVTKGGNGTVYIPLQPDDPLFDAGADGDPLTLADNGPNFMALTRATVFGPNADTQNTTTPFVDQNQTYTSHPSHQVFLREYVLNAAGDAVSTGRMLDGAGGIGTWAEVKAQAKDMLGLILGDFDVHDVPLLETDPYGKFIPGDNGFAQVWVSFQEYAPGVGGPPTPVGAPVLRLIEGTAAGLNLANVPVPGDIVPTPSTTNFILPAVQHTGHAFLNDISHHAAPGTVDHDHNPATPKVAQVADSDFDANGNGIYDAGVDTLTDVNGDGSITTADFYADDHLGLTYDNEMLGSHFITGDGRGNENIGLTTVHFVFHAEHNRLVEDNKNTIIASGDLAVINEWLLQPVTEVPADLSELVWNGERLFQAARFVTEMQYQHMVFEEFARRIQPNVDFFVFTNSADLDPAILSEFANTVYRFGHSMLTDTVDRLDQDLTLVNSDGALDDAEQIGLIAAFLNPQAFTASGATVEEATGAIIRGMSRQVGNEMDEFIVEALRNNLVGLPLDLAVLNIARGRDTGIPTLNDARTQMYEMSGDPQVKPYTSWFDFAQNIKHPLSIINFIAAYGTHDSILAETTLEGKRDAATLLVLGGVDAPADRLDFLNATNGWADGPLGGLNAVDLWVGGLAEELMEFGGQLGSTFNFVFEYQLEHLQNGDRFYYLSRTQGMNLLNMLEPNTFADIIMRNTDLGDLHATHLSAEIMEVPDMILELDPEVRQENYSGDPANDNASDKAQLDPTHDDSFQQAFDPKVFRQNGTTDLDGDGWNDGNILKFSGGEHVVLGGTEGNDALYGDKGIDTLWGDGGDDYLNPGMESDQVFGGDGDDIIEDPFGDDFLRGEAGNDVIVNGHGLDLLFGGTGNDFLMAATDTTEVFAGEGNDWILGGTAPDVLLGNEGDDWIEGGEGFDGLSGENSELFFNSTIVGHDILNGQGNDTDYDAENGNDIMVQSNGIQRNNGMDGFDWAIHKGDAFAADSDLGIRVFDARQALILRDRFDSVEGLSGWNHDDKLTGAAKLLLGEDFDNRLTQSGVDMIAGLQTYFGAPLSLPTDVVFGLLAGDGSEIILGGAGSDTITGNLGNDILDGDAWLNVRIAVMENKDGTGDELYTVDSLNEIQARLRSGEINPGQLKAVREILNSDGSNVELALDNSANTTNMAGDVDIAVFGDVIANYNIEGGGVDMDGDGFITVTHTVPVGGGGGGGRIADGIDKIRNFEVLQFADQVVILDPAITNTPATGLLAILDGGNPGVTVGETLTAAIGTVIDPDGLPPIEAFTFSWEVEQTAGLQDWIPLDDPVAGNPVTGRVLLITADMAIEGLAVRVVGRFTGNNGIPEVVFSTPTDPVAPAAVAAATLGDDLLVGTLGADLINALAGDDIVQALAGDDVIIGGPGNDILDGGLGNDVAVFSGPLANFTLVLNAEGILEVVDAAAGEEDAIINIETLLFFDGAELTSALVAEFLLTGVEPAGVTVSALSVADILDGEIIIGTAGADALAGGDFPDTITGLGGDDAIDGGVGNDTIFGDSSPILTDGVDGDDTIGWRVGDGRDLIDGGGDATAAGDTFDIRGNNAGDLFRIYTADEAEAAGFGPLDGATTEAVVTRDDGTGEVVIAELDNIESIVINAVAVTATNSGEIVAVGGDTVIAIGDFAATSLTNSLPSNLPPTGMTLNGGNSGAAAENDAGAIIGPIVVIDPTVGDTHTFTISDARFEIVGGNLKLVDGVSLDFEAASQIDLVIEVFDAGGLPSTNNPYNIRIGVTDANDAPTGVTLSNSSVNEAAANGTVVAVLSAIDQDSGDTHTFEFADGTTVSGAFRIVGNQLRVLSGVAIDFEQASSMALGIRARDAGGIVSATSDIVISVNDVNPESVIGNANANSIVGGAGNDTLGGAAGNDTLIGANGNDLIGGGAGADSMAGAAGNDTYVVDDIGDAVVELDGAGIDTVRSWLDSYALGANLETLVYLGTGNFNGTGNGANNLIYGRNGLDTLSGGGGSDTLVGGSGNDMLDGGADADLIFGGAGDDTITGGAGNDTVGGAVGNDSLDGGEGADVMSDGLGNNTMLGGAGADTMTSGAGNDMLDGGEGADLIMSGAGDDTLTGGAGNDTMGGGVGNDTLKFAPLFGNDVVVGFDANPVGGQDKIDLTAFAGIIAVNFATQVAITDVGADTLVTIIATGDSIQLLGVGNALTVTVADFNLIG